MLLETNSTKEEFPSWFIPIDILHITCYAITMILAVTFLFIIVYDKLYKTVSVILIMNSCLSELLFSTCLFGMAIFRFRNDMARIHFYNSFCIFIACAGYMTVGLQNYSYLLQAIYRYLLIIHPTQLFYQSIKFQILLISSAWIFCTIYPIALVCTGQIKYLVDDGICQMPLELSFITIFNAFFIYFIPMPTIMVIYLKMVRYVQEMSKHVNTANRLFHAKRELKMIRRIVLLVSILIGLGFPYAIFIIMSFFNSAPKYHFRIAFTFICVSLVLVMGVILEMTEPLKNSLLKRINFRQRNIIVGGGT